jgi:pimeloyl-ACP methyl ester carboxylesterase
MLKRIDAGVLKIAYEEDGTIDGPIVILLHGFPYDIHAYTQVSQLLVDANCHVFTPYLRGYGLTRFISANTMRSGQQAALAHDLLAFMDALKIENAVLAGYDWGGRAACIVAALWPNRVRGLVSGGGYLIQNIAASMNPHFPEDEMRYWYQYYFHSERGQAGLSQNRHELCRLLWKMWSPNWNFDAATYVQTAASFNNPDFVEVVIHSYRHRFGLVTGDPAYEDTERELTQQPKISVPTIVVDAGTDGVVPLDLNRDDSSFFTGRHERRIFTSAGHNLPQEAAEDFASAVLSLV